MGWREHAKCRGLDPELFFPQRGESTAEAKAICAVCPVRVQCLEYALLNDERQGIYGETTGRDRRRIRRRRKAC